MIGEKSQSIILEKTLETNIYFNLKTILNNNN
jgi:hypothetical protein